MTNETIFLVDDIFDAVIKFTVPLKIKLILRLLEEEDVFFIIEGYFEEYESIKRQEGDS